MWKVYSLFAFLALAACSVTQNYGQELDASGDGQAETPSLLDDYVNCPPDEEMVKNILDLDYPELSALTRKDDESYVPLVEDDAKLGSFEDDNSSTSESNTQVITEDSSVFQSSGEELNDDSVGFEDGYRLVKPLPIYDVPETASLDAKFASYISEHPDETELTSPNYEKPYPPDVNSLMNYTVSGGIGVQITLHDLDLDPTKDYLYIRGGSIDEVEEKGPVFTGTIKEPVRILIPHTTTFTVHFVSQHEDEDHKHRGFRLTYAPFGTIVSPTPPTTPVITVPPEELQFIQREITVSRAIINSNDTWTVVKQAISNASNAYIMANQLKYQLSSPEDIKISVRQCPESWPNYEECATLNFAVPLRPEVVELEDELEPTPEARGFIPLTTTEEPEPEYELSRAHLEQMWNNFGAVALADVGIEVYKIPESLSVLFIWLSISLCIVAAFIFVLYSIWKIDIFKDYRRISKLNREPQEEDRSELKKKEFDISMFPSPHQIVPSLFPTGDPYGDRSPEAQYAYDNSTMHPWAGEAPDDLLDARFSNANNGGGNQGPQKQQVFEPLSPLDYSPDAMDFNEMPRSPRRSKNNPFLSPNGRDFNQAGTRQ